MAEGIEKQAICFENNVQSFSSMRMFIAARSMIDGETVALKILTKILPILAQFPEVKVGQVGKVARFYPGLGVLTVGFMDHLGEFDPILNYPLPSVLGVTLAEIEKDIEEGF